jgi:hypothetical protein
VILYLQLRHLHCIGFGKRRFCYLVIEAALKRRGIYRSAAAFETVAYILMASQCIVEKLLGRAA